MLALRTVTYCTENEETPVRVLLVGYTAEECEFLQSRFKQILAMTQPSQTQEALLQAGAGLAATCERDSSGGPSPAMRMRR